MHTSIIMVMIILVIFYLYRRKKVISAITSYGRHLFAGPGVPPTRAETIPWCSESLPASLEPTPSST